MGNQNCGKTTLFNQLTGANQHVGNFPGVTVDRKDGTIRKHSEAVVTDLPGIYSLSPYSSEEIVTRMRFSLFAMCMSMPWWVVWKQRTDRRNVCEYQELSDSYWVNSSLSEMWEGIGTLGAWIYFFRREKYREEYEKWNRFLLEYKDKKMLYYQRN